MADPTPRPEQRMFTVEQATVYRSAGRRYFSRRAATFAYARAKFRAKHPCECESADYASGYPGFNCHVHDLMDRVLPRYLRRIRKASR